MRWVARLLVLLLALPQAKAKGVALCDRAAADPDAAIPGCTQLMNRFRGNRNSAPQGPKRRNSMSSIGGR
jgi:hypothetical protein